jgi:hypothetical protein
MRRLHPSAISCSSRNLLAVEDAFKTAKALLATRPIFHKTDAGIRGHVFCTFLALVLRKELIDRLTARPEPQGNTLAPGAAALGNLPAAGAG